MREREGERETRAYTPQMLNSPYGPPMDPLSIPCGYPMATFCVPPSMTDARQPNAAQLPLCEGLNVSPTLVTL